MSESGVLTEDECLSLLRAATIGRFGVVVDGYPMIFPVNYALDGNRITFRTGTGTKFDAAQSARVSFQVDQMVTLGRSAWSVLVLGTATVPDAGDPDTLRRLRELDITPLEGGDKPLWVQIVPHRITGRHVIADEVGYPLDPRGYL